MELHCFFTFALQLSSVIGINTVTWIPVLFSGRLIIYLSNFIFTFRCVSHFFMSTTDDTCLHLSFAFSEVFSGEANSWEFHDHKYLYSIYVRSFLLWIPNQIELVRVPKFMCSMKMASHSITLG